MTTATRQTWNPHLYSEHGRFVSDLGQQVVELLAPRPAERILDLGCGDGALTQKLADSGCRVTGVDASAEMVAAAQSRGLDACMMDARGLPFEQTFDAVFTNAALHWIKQPDEVIAGVWRALRPGGRFVGECGGHGNVVTIVAALESAIAKRGVNATTVNPWYFPGDEEYRWRLETRGFSVNTIELFPRPTPLPGDIVGWLETFAQSFTAVLPVSERDAFLREVAALCRPKLCDAEGRWTADYVRLRFAATKPSHAA